MPAKDFDEGDKISYYDENNDKIHEGVVIKVYDDENTTIVIQNGQTLELEAYDTVQVIGSIKQATKKEIEEKVSNYIKEDVSFSDEDYQKFISGKFDDENVPDYSGMFEYENDVEIDEDGKPIYEKSDIEMASYLLRQLEFSVKAKNNENTKVISELTELSESLGEKEKSDILAMVDFSKRTIRIKN